MDSLLAPPEGMNPANTLISDLWPLGLRRKFFFFFQILAVSSACRILVPQPRIIPAPPALRAHSLNHGLPGKSPKFCFKPPGLWEFVRAGEIRDWSHRPL